MRAARSGFGDPRRTLLEQRPNTTFTLALTVLDRAGGVPRDVLVRGTAEQTVGELAHYLAVYLDRPAVNDAGQPLAMSLRVERTNEYLRPDAPLQAVDLLDGDVVMLVTQHG